MKVYSGVKCLNIRMKYASFVLVLDPFILRANFLMNSLFKMLCIYNGTNFASRIGCPVWRDNFYLRFAGIESAIQEKKQKICILCYCSKNGCKRKAINLYRPVVGSLDGLGPTFGLALP